MALVRMIETMKKINGFDEPLMKLKDIINVQWRIVESLTDLKVVSINTIS
jgi:hypothetical protein